MKNNATKTVNGEDRAKKNSVPRQRARKTQSKSYFGWSDAECQSFGINRQEAEVAWCLLHGAKPLEAIAISGYHPSSDIRLITSRISYLQAARAMTVHYSNAVAVPLAIRVNVEIAGSRTAPESSRVGAAKNLVSYAESSLDAFKQEFGGKSGELTLEQLTKAVRHLEQTKHAPGNLARITDVDGQNVVQTPSTDDYLSDFL